MDLFAPPWPCIPTASSSSRSECLTCARSGRSSSRRSRTGRNGLGRTWPRLPPSFQLIAMPPKKGKASKRKQDAAKGPCLRRALTMSLTNRSRWGATAGEEAQDVDEQVGPRMASERRGFASQQSPRPRRQRRGRLHRRGHEASSAGGCRQARVQGRRRRRARLPGVEVDAVPRSGCERHLQQAPVAPARSQDHPDPVEPSLRTPDGTGPRRERVRGQAKGHVGGEDSGAPPIVSLCMHRF